MHVKSDSELRQIAEDFLNRYHERDAQTVQRLFLDEAMMRHSAEDDGDRQAYFDDALIIFAQVSEELDHQAVAMGDA